MKQPANPPPPANSERDKSKPMREAIAMAYRKSDAAPRVVAKGKGLLAEQIIAKAHEHGVYVHESPELVALLTQVDIDEHIPPQLYMAVAELLAWLYRLEHGQSDAPPPKLSVEH